MKTSPVTKLSATGIGLGLMLFVSSATADTLAAAAIAAAVSDRTYQGSMTDNAFAEYYAADGSIRGKDYAGKWRTEDDTMCFQYGDSEEKCWRVIINGAALTLVKDGQVDGSGMLVEGNPHQF